MCILLLSYLLDRNFVDVGFYIFATLRDNHNGGTETSAIYDSDNGELK